MDRLKHARALLVLTGLLRRKMKFGGLIVSDDLEMKAIADRVGVAEAAVRSIGAGADLLLVCKTRERILESIERVAKAIDGVLERLAVAAAA